MSHAQGYCIECESGLAMLSHPSQLCRVCYNKFKQTLRDGFNHEELKE